MNKDIILIGPVGAGKSTVCELISKKIDMPRSDVDAIRWKFYEEIGYNYELADKLMNEEGFLGIYKYWKPFELHSVKRIRDK